VLAVIQRKVSEWKEWHKNNIYCALQYSSCCHWSLFPTRNCHRNSSHSTKDIPYFKNKMYCTYVRF